MYFEEKKQKDISIYKHKIPCFWVKMKNNVLKIKAFFGGNIKNNGIFVFWLKTINAPPPSAPETDTSVPSALDTTATPLAGGDG